MNHSNLLSLQDVQLVYRALPALHHVDWEVNRGQQWACLGPNGAGKTSLAKILSGEARRFSGVYTRSAELREQGVAYVCFEQARTLCERDKKLDDSETRADATDPGTLVQQLILQGRKPDTQFAYWVERLNIGHILQRGLRYISTGEMRKTLLVRAILAAPALLILDSPLDGLDAASQAELSLIIDELLHSDLSLLLLCRQQEDLPAGVSHVMVMQSGHILAQGERTSILARADVQQLMQPPLAQLDTLPAPAPRPYQIPPDAPLLQLNGVNVSYGELQVLRDVHWRFDRGQHCYISGPNGCGKSTLLSLVTGDNHKAYGQDIYLFGVRRGSGESIWDIKQKYGQLDNQLHLNFARGMKVLEVVISGYFDSVGLYDDWGDEQRASAERWLAAVGILDIAHASFDALSFGMQRMALLVRAMVKSPAILLLDEPTLGLDGYHRRLMLRAIDHIAANSDTQVIFVSHCVGDVPACINQHLRFEPDADGFVVRCENR
ncbi:ATP-binding cassette domain-containing protein [Pseudohalioglobus sediminis]|uniref:ATP-binding cassette domain-containing protein n=1 Tax=Pseudohalioglobus sediminis TaxID=2606449 RepID=A0A5B0WYF3_9GAMM|nr:ATP-binding cassette domain-containing protein [Pseudohalioglobus sediminis]KAA1192060.1 ATP-binding cassette domain-containing protein [Pseudohalioglobus sediminis]